MLPKNRSRRPETSFLRFFFSFLHCFPLFFPSLVAKVNSDPVFILAERDQHPPSCERAFRGFQQHTHPFPSAFQGHAFLSFVYVLVPFSLSRKCESTPLFFSDLRLLFCSRPSSRLGFFFTADSSLEGMPLLLSDAIDPYFFRQEVILDDIVRPNSSARLEIN